jgi:hypothetical protein
MVEQRNQTVVAAACGMLKGRGIPSMFWGKAVTMAVYLLNHSSTRTIENATPYERWHGTTPDLHHLCVFRCVVHVKTARPNLKKFEDRNTKMVMLGYEPGSKAYKVFDPLTQRVHVTRDAVFDKAASWTSEEDGVATLRGTSRSSTLRPVQSHVGGARSRNATLVTPHQPRQSTPRTRMARMALERRHRNIAPMSSL